MTLKQKNFPKRRFLLVFVFQIPFVKMHSRSDINGKMILKQRPFIPNLVRLILIVVDFVITSLSIKLPWIGNSEGPFGLPSQIANCLPRMMEELTTVPLNLYVRQESCEYFL